MFTILCNGKLPACYRRSFIFFSTKCVSYCIQNIPTLLAAEMLDIIKMPISHKKQIKNQRLFRQMGSIRNKSGLPGIDGAIDCTHICLIHTKFTQIAELYRNRKGYFSLNVQAVVGPSMEFLNIVPQWLESQHDSRIFQNSRLHMQYTERQLTGVLVGDLGYPCLPFLLTPIANPTTDAEITYNCVHGKTRRIIERTFGVWKRRFSCLSRELTTKLICSISIVMACAVLHNLSLIYDNILPEDLDHYEKIEEGILVEPPIWQPGEGLAMRAAVIDRLYGQIE